MLPCKFLGSRVVYWTLKKAEGDDSTSGGGTSAAAAAAPLPSSGNKKKTRKLQQQQQQLMSAGQAGTGLLQPGYIYPGLLALLEFTEDFDYVVRLAGGCLLGGAWRGRRGGRQAFCVLGEPGRARGGGESSVCCWIARHTCTHQ